MAVIVQDTGEGIAADAMGHIFEPFWKGSQQGESGGLGIGLTLAEYLVALHGGELQVLSDASAGGTTVVVTLPQGNPEVLGADESSPTAVPFRQHRVLIVDDNPDVLDVIAAAVAQLGADAASTRDGPQVLELMRSYRPTVVLLDIGMAPLGGYELARRIREHPDYATIPLIAVTGWGSREDVQRAAAAGFAHHLLKPVALRHLQQVLASIPVPHDGSVLTRTGASAPR